MSEEKNVQIKIDKVKLIYGAIALLGGIFLLLNWIKLKVSFYGYSSSNSVGLYASDMFDYSFFSGLAKVLGIVIIPVLLVYLVSCFIDLKKIVPALGKINLNKWLLIAYFGLYAVIIVCSLIGVLTGENGGGMIKSSPAIGWYLGLITTALGLLLTFKPDLLKKINISVSK